MVRSKKLKDYVGRNEKTKIIAKLQKKGQGAPSREPVFSEEEQKQMMAYAYKKQEELKVLCRPCSAYSYCTGVLITFIHPCFSFV